MLSPYRLRLTGAWQIHPIPLDTDCIPETLSFPRTVPECAHLQSALYADRCYWGDHLRRLNEQAWIYRRAFAAPEITYRRARLLFEGVDYFASVWLNGTFLGQHEGHFAPFTLDSTRALLPGTENILIVRVSSPWDRLNPRGSYPVDHVIRGLVKGQYEHGEGVIPPDVNPLGIWRPVWLLLDDGVSLDRVRVRTELDGTISLCLTATNATEQIWRGNLNLGIAAENHDGPGTDKSVLVNLPPGTHDITQSLRVPEPCLWWPWDHGEPNLYRLSASLQDVGGQVVSSLQETFGIRSVTLERRPDRFVYRINGRPVFLRGSSYMPGMYLSEHDRQTLSRDVDLARDANLNLLRVHVHVSRPELYDLCDRAGMLIWQDFELNWVHDSSPEFETRARTLQRDMIAMLGNHPSIITWSCHNEPTMVFARRQNLEQRPDPALYQDAIEQDPTRPVFICSGQMESDWQRSGDMHSYYGAIWSKNYTDAYRYRFRLNTEFGFEAPAALATLRRYPVAWERLRHLENQIEDLWSYQAELIQYQIEHFRRQRAVCGAGYIHFWLVDLAPQIGCGVLDSCRKPKGGYEALRRASQPLHVAIEHDGRRPHALWIFNDTPYAYSDLTVCWKVSNAGGDVLYRDQIRLDVAANASQQVMAVHWSVAPANCERIDLALHDQEGKILSSNTYLHPFRPSPRPRGYPWKFDPVLGTKVFDRQGAPSLVDLSTNGLFKLVPLAVREACAEWALRQWLHPRLLSIIARIGGWLVE